MKRGMVLIGFRASGKTTLGRTLAKRLGWRFRDLDEEWEEMGGETILSFVERKGIVEFRKSEEILLRRILGQQENASQPAIVSLGGGFVDWQASRDRFEESPLFKVYLEVPAAELWRRLEGDPDRRKIGHLTDFASMQTLLEKRRPFYEKMASYRLGNQDITNSLNQLETLAKRP
jgi:shikimate kinase